MRSAEVRDVGNGRVHQGQERDMASSDIRRAETRCRRAAFLGWRFLRRQFAQGRSDDQALDLAPLAGRSKAWADESIGTPNSQR